MMLKSSLIIAVAVILTQNVALSSVVKTIIKSPPKVKAYIVQSTYTLGGSKQENTKITGKATAVEAKSAIVRPVITKKYGYGGPIGYGLPIGYSGTGGYGGGVLPGYGKPKISIVKGFGFPGTGFGTKPFGEIPVKGFGYPGAGYGHGYGYPAFGLTKGLL